MSGPLHQPAPQRAEQQPVVLHDARPDVPAAYLVLVSAALEVAFGTLLWVGGSILYDKVRQRSAETCRQNEESVIHWSLRSVVQVPTVAYSAPSTPTPTHLVYMLDTG